MFDLTLDLFIVLSLDYNFGPLSVEKSENYLRLGRRPLGHWRMGLGEPKRASAIAFYLAGY